LDKRACTWLFIFYVLVSRSATTTGAVMRRSHFYFYCARPTKNEASDPPDPARQTAVESNARAAHRRKYITITWANRWLRPCASSSARDLGCARSGIKSFCPPPPPPPPHAHDLRAHTQTPVMVFNIVNVYYIFFRPEGLRALVKSRVTEW